MKRFLLNILIFLLPLIIMAVYIFIAPYEKEFAYGYIKDSCFNRGKWIYGRVVESEQPIDIAFIGTSHTLNGVEDSILESMFNAREKDNKHFANLAYCWEGLNMHYVILKDLVKYHDPETIVFEVREKESAINHKIFAYVAESEDILTQPFFLRSDCLGNFYNAGISRFEFMIHKNKYMNSPSNSMSNFGFEPAMETADTSILMQQKIIQYMAFGPGGEFENGTMEKFDLYYFNKIMEICKDENIKVCFLYIPSYGDILGKPLNYDLYKKYGEVFLPPQEILSNHTYWANTSHINYRGAGLFSAWLSEQNLKN